MIYDVNYFIAKFEAIPEHFWICGSFNDKTGLKHCALGFCVHIRQRRTDPPYDTEFNALVEIFKCRGFDVVRVNDGTYEGVVKTSPRERILAKLYDFKQIEGIGAEQAIQEANVEAVKAILSNPVLEEAY